MKQPRRRSGLILGLLALGLLAGVALTAGPAQAQVAGPYYAVPAWDQNLPAATRFVVLTNWASAAVLDKQTGLVWEKSPSITPVTWWEARDHCTKYTTTGNRTGWRLPAVHELTSLIYTNVPTPGLTLPPGHPFLLIRSNVYWSATGDADQTTQDYLIDAWFVDFSNGFVSVLDKGDISIPHYAWCVRGGLNAARY